MWYYKKGRGDGDEIRVMFDGRGTRKFLVKIKGKKLPCTCCRLFRAMETDRKHVTCSLSSGPTVGSRMTRICPLVSIHGATCRSLCSVGLAALNLQQAMFSHVIVRARTDISVWPKGIRKGVRGVLTCILAQARLYLVTIKQGLPLSLGYMYSLCRFPWHLREAYVSCSFRY